MRTKDLHVGDVVFVRRPYCGGCGEAEIVELEAGRVVVKFLRGGIGVTVGREYEVAPARVYRLVRPHTDPEPVPLGGRL